MADRVAVDAVNMHKSAESPTAGWSTESAGLAAWGVEAETTFADVPDGVDLDHAYTVFMSTFVRLAAS